MVATLATGACFVTLGVASQLINIAFGMWFSELFIFLGVPFLVLRLAGYDGFRTAGLSRPWAAGALFGFVAGAVNFFALVVPLQFLSQSVAPKALVEMFDVSGIFKRQTPLELVAVVLGVCLAAPFCEEFFFRGLLQRGLQKVMSGVRALVLTGFIFSAFHFDPVGFLARWELGILFGLLMLRSGSIWPGVFAHLANNAVSVGLYFASAGSEADEDLVWWVPLAMFAVGAPLLWLVLKLPERWPAAMTPAFVAVDTPRPARPARLVGAWALAAGVAVGVLFAADYRGIRLNLVDAFHPLKEPKKVQGAQRMQAWEALYVLRAEVRSGSAKLEEYEAARKAAIADRASTEPGAQR